MCPKKYKKISVFFILVFLWISIMPGTAKEAASAELKLLPSIAIKEEYNDNILYTTSGAMRDFITTISPGVTFIDRTEKIDLSLSGRIDRLLYSKYGEWDSTDQYYEGAGRFVLTERSSLSGKVAYSDDSRPDRDLETTGIPLGPVKRIRQNYGITGAYALSETTSTTLSYEYLNDDYYNDQYIDSEVHAFNLGFTKDLTYFARSTKGRLNLGYSKYNMTGSYADNYEATLGLSRDLTEKWSLIVDGGVRYTYWKYKVADLQRTIFDPATPPFFFPVYTEQEDTSRAWGAVARMAVNYKGERSKGSLSIGHDLSPPGGRTGTVERTSIIFNLNTRITYELYGTLYGGYFLNKSSEGDLTSKVDEETIWLSPGIRYEWNKNASMELSYTYDRTRYNTIRDYAGRNLFLVRFRMQFDLLN